VRQVVRSQPTYRRQLLFASALFTVLFVADLLVVGDLVFRDLGHQVVHEAFRVSLLALEIDPRPVVPDPAEDAATQSRPIEDCPPAAPQSAAPPGPCLHPPREPEPAPPVFRSGAQPVERVIADARGNILRRWIDEAPAPAASAARPGTVSWRPREGGTWTIGDRPLEVIAVAQAAPPGRGAFREVGIPREEIEKEMAQIRRDLTLKVWTGAGLAAIILAVAFGYVLRLLHRTRLLEAQAQMDDRLAYVGGLAAGLAHEIRNPLNVLSMNLQMLEEEIAAKGGGEETRVYLTALQGEIRRLSTLVNNFLSYARPNRPRFETRDLNGILRGICLLLRPEFEAKQLTLHEDLSPYLPPVDLDEAQFRQAVMNILQNAGQVSRPGGRVTVESRVGPQGEAIIAVQDEGPGIKPEERDRIFEVFVSNRRGGTGLGLPIAARILQSHGGGIEVESAPGRGARFVLTLPRRHPQASPAGGTRPATEMP
jgi:signal transduction histidine kinase